MVAVGGQGEESAPRAEHATDLPHKPLWVTEVLQDIDGKGDVKAIRLEGKFIDVGDDALVE
jgi:hypothetical protein